MLTPRENFFETVNWGNPEYIPFVNDHLCLVGMPTMPLVDEPLSTGQDPFGVYWVVTPEGATLDTTKPPLLDDIMKWRDVVHFPDLEAIDFEGIAAAELGAIDATEKVKGYFAAVGCFERLVSLMGYLEGMTALLEEPEECKAFFDAFTDYRIAVANKIIDAYDIDIYYNFDDIATANNLFISLDTYREVIKPYHAKLAQAVIDRGVIFAEHTCGRCENVLEDYVDIGVKVWHSAQPMNDLAGIIEKFQGRLVVEGGWDTSGTPSMLGATEDDIRAEVDRCIDEYGGSGGFILMHMILNEKGNSLLYGDDREPALVDEWMKYRAL